jgi:exosortase/archaeosortase family protein
MPELEKNDQPSMVKGLLPLVIFTVLASQDFVVEIYGAICKPIALYCLELWGLSTVDHGLYFTVEQLHVPWTRDCAGMNLLLVLLAVYAWMNRDLEQNAKYFWRMACVLPAAIASNVLRVLTLVAYRYFVFPELESPQLHYFFGLFWLIPFALFAIPPKTGRSKKALFFELLHISTVVALLAPLLSLSHHWITALATLLFLFNSKFPKAFHKHHISFVFVWFLLAIFIIWVGIESLWLPWLLCCPLVINLKWLRSPSGIFSLVLTCPLVVLLPAVNIWGFAILLWASFICYQQKELETKSDLFILNKTMDRSITACVAPLLFLPFMASMIFTVESKKLEPPKGVKQRILQGMGYELRLDDQSPHLGLLWYDAQGADRHHTVEICLQYRGVHLKDASVPMVKTDGQRWFKEFFIVGEKLLVRHSNYLWETFGFRQDPGIHIIIVAEQQNFTAEEFSQSAELTANTLFKSLFKIDHLN